MGPAWRSDPTSRHQERYFDGTSWTARVRDRGIENEDQAGLTQLAPQAAPPLASTTPPPSATPPPPPAPAIPPLPPTGAPTAAAWTPADSAGTVLRGTSIPPATGTPGIPGTPPAPAPMATIDPTREMSTPTAPEAPTEPNRTPIIIAAVVAAFVVLLGGAAIALSSGGDNQTDAKKDKTKKGASVDPADLLAPSDTAVTDTLDSFGQATTLAQFDAAAAQAKTAAVDIEGRLDDAATIEGKALRKATTGALSEEHEVLVAFGGMQGYTGDNLTQWTLLSASADEHAKALETHLDDLDELDAYAPETDVVAAIANTRTTATTNLGTIADKLAAWSADVDRVQADKDAQLATVNTYASAVTLQTDAYSDLRADTQEFVDNVDINGATYDEMYSYLERAVSSRIAVRDSLDAITPLSCCTTEQSALADVITNGADGMQAAIDGVVDYQSTAYTDCIGDDYHDPYDYYDYETYCYDYNYYASYKDTPGWQSYLSTSDENTTALKTALSAWETAVAGERDRINAIALPAKPAV